MLISVVIPTYRRVQTLRATLDDLLASELRADDWEVIVVDDADDARTAAVVAEVRDEADVPVVYVTNARRGAAAARNAGARLASGETLLFLDDDIRVSGSHLTMHLETHAKWPRSIVGGVRWYAPEALDALRATPFGRYRIELERGFTHGRGEREETGTVVVATLPSFDMSMSREQFRSLDGFDESFPYAGAEDQDLSARALAAGMRLVRNNDMRVLHDDRTLTLRQFAQREWQGAHTVLALVRKFPQFEGDFVRNAPLSVHDRPALIAYKVLKAGLSRRRVRESLVAATEQLERMGAPDGLLAKLYRPIVGLYTFDGYRHAIKVARVSRP